MLLLIKIFHQQHKHAISFVLIRRQEFCVVYNVFDVVVVELSVQNLNQECPRSNKKNRVFKDKEKKTELQQVMQKN
jgi:hypothetical protein